MRTRPDYGEWELHKAQIEQIYLHENKTQKELSMIMEETHGFRKTKAQYENAFERWNFKKYKMTPEKWKVVKYRIEKRKREKEKESEVYINGILCSPKKVTYEIGRHVFESTIARLTSGSSDYPTFVVTGGNESDGFSLSWKTTKSLKLTQISPRVTAAINVSMPEEYDDQNRIVSLSNGESSRTWRASWESPYICWPTIEIWGKMNTSF
ncbi:hypothetical protein N7530_009424 [Penicillium desertorum]|uniref:Clr5 domain-containing protein n=1 Tax=Penicillium desertorum TaxID=1303715 RepID=A0A9W9WJ49_9EURO|nr:hypothetical protein N7530_009424 [Penicillium desertorum]